MTDFPNVTANAEDCTAAGTDDRQAEPAQPQLPVPDEPAAVLEQFQTRIDELTQERDQARRELDQALQNLELARSVQPRAVGPDLPSRCSVCRKQRDEVKAMFTNPRSWPDIPRRSYWRRPRATSRRFFGRPSLPKRAVCSPTDPTR